MSLRLVRRIALLLAALYAFGQGTVALAACDVKGGSMAAMPADDGCDGCGDPTTHVLGPVCVFHCSADSQLTAASPEPLADTPVAFLKVAPPARFDRPPAAPCHPPGSPPRRILLHSFQI